MASEVPLQAHAEDLQRTIRQHKAAIRHHREALGTAKAALVTLEEECRRRGIRLVLEPKGVAKEHSHGLSERDPASDS